MSSHLAYVGLVDDAQVGPDEDGQWERATVTVRCASHVCPRLNPNSDSCPIILYNPFRLNLPLPLDTSAKFQLFSVIKVKSQQIFITNLVFGSFLLTLETVSIPNITFCFTNTDALRFQLFPPSSSLHQTCVSVS